MGLVMFAGIGVYIFAALVIVLKVGSCDRNYTVRYQCGRRAVHPDCTCEPQHTSADNMEFNENPFQILNTSDIKPILSQYSLRRQFGRYFAVCR